MARQTLSGAKSRVFVLLLIAIILGIPTLNAGKNPEERTHAQQITRSSDPTVTFKCYSATISLQKRANITIHYPERTERRTLLPGTHTVRGEGKLTGHGIAAITIRRGAETHAFRNPNYPLCSESTTTTTVTTTTTTAPETSSATTETTAGTTAETSTATTTSAPTTLTARGPPSTATTDTTTITTSGGVFPSPTGPPAFVDTTASTGIIRTSIEQGTLRDNESAGVTTTPHSTSGTGQISISISPTEVQSATSVSESETTRQAPNPQKTTHRRGDGRPSNQTRTQTHQNSTQSDLSEGKVPTEWENGPRLVLIGLVLVGLVAGAGLAMSSRVQSRVRAWGEYLKKSLPYGIPPLTDQEEAVLDTETRERIWKILVNTPGLSQTEVADQMGIERSTVKYHLKILRREDIIDPIRVGHSIRYVPRGLDNPDSFVVIRDETLRELFIAIGESSGKVTNTMLADEFGELESTITRRVHRLEDAGLVTTTYNGREGRVELTEKGKLRFFAL